MKKDDRKYNMCDRKRGFFTRNQAKKVAKKLRKKGQKGVRPYKCKFCEAWHNGHPTPAKTDENGLIIDDI